MLVSGRRAEARSFIVDALYAELVGPRSEQEVLEERPDLRYLVGHLAPSIEFGLNIEEALEGERELADATKATWEESDLLSPFSAPDSTGDTSDETRPSDDSMRDKRRRSLSAIGISFVTDWNVAVRYKASWGEYAPAERGRFVRSSCDAEGEFRISDGALNGERIHGRAAVTWSSRPLGSKLICSIFLINRSGDVSSDGTDRLYQVVLSLAGGDGLSQPFFARSATTDHRKHHLDADDLLYRDRSEFAVGHNVSVRSDLVNEARKRCGSLVTETLPRFESRLTLSNAELDSHEAFDMAFLARESDDTRIVDRLRAAFSSYDRWIQEEESRISSLPESFQLLASAQMLRCKERLRRISQKRASIGASSPGSPQENRVDAIRHAPSDDALDDTRNVWLEVASSSRETMAPEVPSHGH